MCSASAPCEAPAPDPTPNRALGQAFGVPAPPPPRFRIKVWDEDTGAVIYDNQIGSTDAADAAGAIEGGSIVIHAGAKSG